MMIVDIGGELILETTNLQMPGRIGIHISMPSDDDEECYPVAWVLAWPKANHAAEADPARLYNAYLRDDGCEKVRKVNHNQPPTSKYLTGDWLFASLRGLGHAL
jgi:hypothetical protein